MRDIQRAEEAISQSEVAWYGKDEYEGTAFGVVEIGSYPYGEPVIEWDNRVEVQRVLLRPRSMFTFMAAMFWVDALTARGHPVPELILPFVPGARQDRLNRSGDYLFTAKSVADMVNQRRFPRVTVLDPHSNVISALIERIVVLEPDQYFVAVEGDKWNGVILPDAGSEKRAGVVAKKLGVGLFHAWKARDITTNEISGFGLQKMPEETHGDSMLVVDDICDAGGTFIGLADKIDEQGIRSDLFVTHGLFSKGVLPLLERYGQVITTDSIVMSGAVTDAEGSPDIASRVRIMPVCKQLLMMED